MTRQQKRRAQRESQKPKQVKKLKGILWDGWCNVTNKPIGGFK